MKSSSMEAPDLVLQHGEKAVTMLLRDAFTQIALMNI